MFQRAWNNYLENELPKKKSKTNFIMAAEACSNDFTITPEVVNEAMKAAEVKHSERTSRRIVAHLSPVISVLRGYGTILEALGRRVAFYTFKLQNSSLVSVSGSNAIRIGMGRPQSHH